MDGDMDEWIDRHRKADIVTNSVWTWILNMKQVLCSAGNSQEELPCSKLQTPNETLILLLNPAQKVNSSLEKWNIASCREYITGCARVKIPHCWCFENNGLAGIYGFPWNTGILGYFEIVFLCKVTITLPERVYFCLRHAELTRRKEVLPCSESAWLWRSDIKEVRKPL